MSRVRTRFAPSPTGSLHVGNARTAVLNWLVARHHGGDFILRIEDTDTARNVAGSEARLLEDLRWLGLDWDEGPTDEGAGEQGPHGPYRQSRRGELHARRARQLLDAGAAYRCFCDEDTLRRHREAARSEGRSPRYPGTCRSLEPGDATRRAEAGEPHVLRLRSPDRGEIVVRDLIRGDVTFDAAHLGDFVLVRSDGIPTYNFAVVVDDADMEISHVIRGAGHLSNTPYQLLVYQALGLEPPAFAHAPTVLGPDRTKLSKRSGAPALKALREEGLHPDGLLNYLSLLGWSSPSEDEVLERDRLVREVTLDRVGPGDVVFDADKMRWLSGRHIAAMDDGALAEAVAPFIADSGCRALLDNPSLPVALAAVRSHLDAFGQIVPQLAPFLPPEAPSAPPEAAPVLRAVAAALADAEPWTEAAVGAALKAGGEAAGVRGRDLYVPVRQALTGEDHGPPLPAIIVVQGREAVLRALDRAAGE